MYCYMIPSLYFPHGKVKLPNLALVFLWYRLFIFEYPLKYLNIVVLGHPSWLVFIIFHLQVLNLLLSSNPI